MKMQDALSKGVNKCGIKALVAFSRPSSHLVCFNCAVTAIHGTMVRLTVV